MALKIFSVFLSVLVLIQLLTGKAMVNRGIGSGRGLSRGTIHRSERPGAYWGAIIFECLVILLIVLHLLHKLPVPKNSPPDWVVWPWFALWYFFAALLCYYARDPSWRERLGISARTAILFGAFLASVPTTVIPNILLNFRVEVLLFLPFLLVLSAVISGRIDSRQ